MHSKSQKKENALCVTREGRNMKELRLALAALVFALALVSPAAFAAVDPPSGLHQIARRIAQAIQSTEEPIYKSKPVKTPVSKKKRTAARSSPTLSLAATVAHSDDDAAWKAVKSVQETPSKGDADEAAEEAQYLKELTEVLAKNGIKDPTQQAQLLIKRGKDLETENGRFLVADGYSPNIFAFQFWNAAKVWLALGIPHNAVRDLMPVYGYVMMGVDEDKHPEDEDLYDHSAFETAKTLDWELSEIIGDAIIGKQAAAKRLHVEGLQNLQPKDRCARIITVLTKRFKARADRERE
jgi:hypothetical protein